MLGLFLDTQFYSTDLYFYPYARTIPYHFYYCSFEIGKFWNSEAKLSNFVLLFQNHFLYLKYIAISHEFEHQLSHFCKKWDIWNFDNGYIESIDLFG